MIYVNDEEEGRKEGRKYIYMFYKIISWIAQVFAVFLFFGIGEMDI